MVLGRFERGWEEWGVEGWGRLGFAIDRSKKYIKTIENYMKIDAVDP